MQISLAWRVLALLAVSLACLVQPAAADLLAAAQACPDCSEAVNEGQSGFFWAMVLMMAAPYLAVGLIGGGIFYAHRRSREEEVERWLEQE